MSTGDRIPLADALHIAGGIVGQLAPSCARLEIAGSIRRRKPDIGDIELVAIPYYHEEPSSLWGDTTRTSVLDGALALEEAGKRLERISGGERYVKLRHLRSGLQVDLFITTREQWGLIELIRTGPADYSQWLVTRARRQGYHVCNGWLRRGLLHESVGDCLAERIPTPEEADVYSALGLAYAEPWERAL